MQKVRIKVITIGHTPPKLNLKRIEGWKSKLFELTGPIENIALRCNSDIENWAFSDKAIKSQLPKTFEGDFMIAIGNIPIEENYYSRRVEENKIIFSFHEIKEILKEENIPIENAILRVLYSYTIGFHRAERKIPAMSQLASFTHDETRGCIFDMNGIKQDIVASCHDPIICPECQERSRREKVPTQVIYTASNEIRKIRKDAYHIIEEFIKTHPIASIFISSTIAIIINMTASWLYDSLKSLAKSA